MSELEPSSEGMEPKLTTDSELTEVLAELVSREPIFHRAEHGTTRADFERMTTNEFWGVGASGRRYSRAYVLDLLETRFARPHEDVWEAREFNCRHLSGEAYLLTYTLVQDGVRVTRRSTIWQRSADGWKSAYHQGTLVEDQAGS